MRADQRRHGEVLGLQRRTVSSATGRRPSRRTAAPVERPLERGRRWRSAATHACARLSDGTASAGGTTATASSATTRRRAGRRRSRSSASAAAWRAWRRGDSTRARLLSNGLMERCWGDNGYGELGNGTTTSHVPVVRGDAPERRRGGRVAGLPTRTRCCPTARSGAGATTLTGSSATGRRRRGRCRSS